MTGPQLYLANATAVWAHTDSVSEPAPGVILEDSFGAPIPHLPETVTIKHMPVMLRPAGATAPFERGGVDVVRVSTLDDLAVAEQVIARGFSVEDPVGAGELLPPAVLGVAGWHVWLARRDGNPGAGCFTYDDGASVGVYLLATVPEHRSAGLGRAIMTSAVNRNPDRPTTLVATEAGAPLYRSMGFVDVCAAVWYFRMAL